MACYMGQRHPVVLIAKSLVSTSSAFPAQPWVDPLEPGAEGSGGLHWAVAQCREKKKNFTEEPPPTPAHQPTPAQPNSPPHSRPSAMVKRMKKKSIFPTILFMTFLPLVLKTDSIGRFFRRFDHAWFNYI